MTTVGYGDVVPITDSERAFTIFAMIVGGGFYGYVVAQATRVVADFDAQRGPYYQKMDTLRSWLTYHQVPLHVRRHVRRYYRTYFSHRTAFDERAIIDDLDPVSREKIADHVLPSCIRHNDLFGVLPRGALCKLIDVVRLVHFRAGEPLVAEGDRCGSMFVLSSGKVGDCNGRASARRVYRVAGRVFAYRIVAGNCCTALDGNGCKNDLAQTCFGFCDFCVKRLTFTAVESSA